MGVFNKIVIIVEDNGYGIPRSEQKKVFKPFVRARESIRQQHPGSGLGLHLVKRLVRFLGGSITLESPYLNMAGIKISGCRFNPDA